MTITAEDLTVRSRRDEEGDVLRIDAGEVVKTEKKAKQRAKKKPRGLKWRTSSWYITTVVGVGVATDALAYNIVVPVLPFRLQALEYTNISALTSWLLFAYSIGIFLCSLPVAYFFDRYPWRREPLVVAVLILEGALVLFMLCTPYWVMVVSRFLMGAASSVVWTVGFALICENVEEKNIGRQLGWAVSGVSVGTTIAPPIGGALYARLGWHAPFIFTIILCAIDLIARLFVIEQKDLQKWEPAGVETVQVGERKEDIRSPTAASQLTLAEVDESFGDRSQRLATPDQPKASNAPPTSTSGAVQPESVEVKTPPKKLTPWGVLIALARSRRGMSAFLMTFIYGIVLGALDPTLTLRVQSVWGKDSAFVGLIYLAASAPTFVTGPIVGHLADKYGAEWIVAPSLFLALPCLPLLILTKSLPGFIVIFAIAEIFLSCALGPIGLELTMAAREVEGMSEIHQFAAMNIAFSVSTSIGAVAGGQMYESIPSGWSAVIWFIFGLCALFLAIPFYLTGSRPLAARLRARLRPKSADLGQDPPDPVVESA